MTDRRERYALLERVLGVRGALDTMNAIDKIALLDGTDAIGLQELVVSSVCLALAHASQNAPADRPTGQEILAHSIRLAVEGGAENTEKLRERLAQHAQWVSIEIDLARSSGLAEGRSQRSGEPAFIPRET